MFVIEVQHSFGFQYVLRERAENFDADELRRDAYEEGWNKLQ